MFGLSIGYSPAATIRTNEKIHLMYQSPTVPIFLLKTKKNERFAIKKSSDFIAPRLQKLYDWHYEKLPANQKLIELKPMEKYPDIRFAQQITIDGDFSTFIRHHQIIAAELTKIFTVVIDTDYEQLPSYIGYIRDRINPLLFYYALTVALAHSNNENTRSIRSDFVNAFPMNFFSIKKLKDAKIGFNKASTSEYTLPATGTYIDEEYRVAYFREDVGFNSHHNYWHIVYPAYGDYVDKDRRGELFFYMHQQIMGRYNCERLCASLARVKSFVNFDETIPEGYYSKLHKSNSNHEWAGRPANLAWHNINRPGDKIYINIHELTDWRMRIEKAIDFGYVVDEKESKLDLSNVYRVHYKKLDIDTLGNMIEASNISPNNSLYGNLHNYGHIVTGFIHDPLMKYSEYMGVMGESSTAIRDPMFFRWHGKINDIFQKFKKSKNCPPYKSDEVQYDDMSVVKVTLLDDTEFDMGMNFATFWTNTIIKVNSFDFESNEFILVNYKHLDHTPFIYIIEVDNKKDEARKGTVRIFLAPKFDENSARFQLNAQRHLFIEMDRFVQNFEPGLNEIRRKSVDSAVTIPLDQAFPETYKKSTDNQDIYCKCGLPQNLLVPKGTLNGAKFQLFVMVSDYKYDEVSRVAKSVCAKEGTSFCGIKDNKYPDARDMGYPFDRQFNASDVYVDDFMKNHKNMMISDVTITFKDITVEDPKNMDVIRD